MSKEQQGKKISADLRAKVIGVYLGCLSYRQTAKLVGIAPNSVKNIIKKEKKTNAKNFAKLCTELYKKNNKLIEECLEEVQEAQFLSAYYLLDGNLKNPYKLNRYMNLQDKQLIKRTKILYEAKNLALLYEAQRIERALRLRDLKELVKLLKEAEKDTSLYEPIDLDFLGTPAWSGTNWHEKKITQEQEAYYIKQIEDYLKSKGYDLTNIDLKDYLVNKKEAFNYYYF